MGTYMPTVTEVLVTLGIFALAALAIVMLSNKLLKK